MAAPMARLRVEAEASAAARIFFVFIFLCQIPSGSVFLRRLPTDSGWPWVACGNEPTEVQNGAQDLFLFFLKIYFQKTLDSCGG